MLKLILNIVYAILSIGGGWYLLSEYHSRAGATAMFYVVTLAVIVFVVVGLLLISIYVPSSDSGGADSGPSLGA